MLQTPCPNCLGAGKKVLEHCSGCSGTGQKHSKKELVVTVPAGAMNGHVLNVNISNDVALHIELRSKMSMKVSDKCTLHRSTTDPQLLIAALNLPWTVLVLGGNIDIQLPDGSVKNVPIAKGTQVGTTSGIQDLGFPDPTEPQNGRGPLVISIEPSAVPTKLTQEQEETIKKLSELGL